MRNLAPAEVAAATAGNFRRFFRTGLKGLRRLCAGGYAERGKAIALLTVKEIFDLVRDDLVRVEQELAEQTGSASEPVAEIARYLLGGGGKRLAAGAAAALGGLCRLSAGRAPFVWARRSS